MEIERSPMGITSTNTSSRRNVYLDHRRSIPLPVCLSTIRIGHRVLRTNVKQVDGLEFFVVKGNYINLRKRRSCNVDIRIIRGCLTRRYPINEIEIAALSAALLS